MSTLKAILGPTNTGKTHYAIERMMAHGTGMIGLPLRLLAREVYDRVVSVKGESQVALLTGEERIEPSAARYYIATVESMPVGVRTDFVAVDEIQLAADDERGHVFTDRLLHMRGHHETLLLGADTMRGVLRDLKLGNETEPRERFSELKYCGHTKITKLPKRTAIVAFSAEDVYAIAELIRRQKGGAAVVMGGLSPRTRNAQVALYQSGEVDYIVATDAIGMGLNLDVERVVFADRVKFDGRRHRRLTAAEIGQIAGRAGRFRTGGEFGETGDCPLFEEELWHAVEAHRFDPVDTLLWRNAALDYGSLKRLIRSLEKPSGHPALVQNPHALDEWILRRLSEDSAVGPDIEGERNVRRIWDLARLPDFRKAGPEGHGRLVLGLASTLADPDQRLSSAGMERRLDELARTQGDIAQLQQRLASIRTWTYAAHRDDWLEDPARWRARTREIEDSLSDALHTALTARFVDRRTTQLLASLKKEDALVTDLMPDGDVYVEGYVIGRLKGLTFEPVLDARTLEGKAVRSAALAAIRPLITERLAILAGAPAEALKLNDEGELEHKGESVARLLKGPVWILPRVEMIGAIEVEPHERAAALNRLDEWVRTEIARLLPAHWRLAQEKTSEALDAPARGLAFRVMEGGAAVDLRHDDPPVKLSAEQREALKASGIRAGRVAAHVPDAQKPAAQRLIALLKAVHNGQPFALAPEGAGSFALDGTWPDESLQANGYLRFGRRALRADLAERLGWEIAKRRKEAGKNAFALPIELASMISCPADDWPVVLRGFGLAPAEREKEGEAVVLWRYIARARPDENGERAERASQPRRERGPRPQRSNRGPRPPNSPAATEAPSAASGEAVAGAVSDGASTPAADPNAPARSPRSRRDRGGRHQRGASGTGNDAQPQSGHRPPREERHKDKRGDARRDGRPNDKSAAYNRGPREAPPVRVRINPDSPFAALAVLLPALTRPPEVRADKPKHRKRGGRGQNKEQTKNPRADAGPPTPPDAPTYKPFA